MFASIVDRVSGWFSGAIAKEAAPQTLYGKVMMLWSDHGLLILVVGVLILFITVAIYRKLTGQKGSSDYAPSDVKKMATDVITERFGPVKRRRTVIIPPDISAPNGSADEDPFRETLGWQSRGERECQRVLEKLYGKPFPKSRPAFLSNPLNGSISDQTGTVKKGNKPQKAVLELDCFNRELRLAVEYSGVQHSKFTPFFHKNEEEFRNQQYRDYIKKELCSRQGVTLIVVPHTVKIKDIESYLLTELGKAGVLP